MKRKTSIVLLRLTKSGIIKGAVNFKFQVCQGFLFKRDFQLAVAVTLRCVNSVRL